MGQPIAIRPIDTIDLDAISEIEAEAFPLDAFTPDRFEQLLVRWGRLFFGAFIASRLRGYVVSSVEGEQADIISLAVSGSARRLGIGSALVAHTVAAVKKLGVRVVVIEVRPSNHDAIEFWERRGWRYVESVPHFYHDGSHALRMRLDLRARP